ncbi:hypothetical protein [Paraburkholderia ginsengiterrae]|uniref:hypothetical protein n=1 Tax=Paraburkholderia ginsengiterrae TaxID=1462993 RepID=UPI0012F94BFD|nr:hypothetical protein [Paraburkholderia ginsengiterrae]
MPASSSAKKAASAAFLLARLHAAGVRATKREAAPAHWIAIRLPFRCYFAVIAL